MSGENLKVGDKVFVHNWRLWSHYEIKTIERETKTQWIIGGSRYRKSDLRDIRRGAYERIIPINQESQAEYDEWFEENQHRPIWDKIQNLKRPLHVSAKRLQEIYDELKGQDKD